MNRLAMRGAIVASILAGGILVSATAVAETLSNDTVVALLDAGLGEEAVIAKIETTNGTYVTDTSTLLTMRGRGVPSSVIAAMVKKSTAPAEMSDSSPDPLTPHFPGVYLLDDKAAEARMWKIDPTSSTQTKTGGILGYAFTGGIASASVKAVIPGERARTTYRGRMPTIYVYLKGGPGEGDGTFSLGYGAAVQSPNEFSLVQLKMKDGRREARIGSMNIGGAKTGVMDKDQIPFEYEQVGKGVYKVQPKAELAPGQYGFIFAIGGGVGPGLAGSAGTAGARVFDFGIE